MNAKCPICQNQPQKDWYPFCSKRCKEIDLGRWFLENYSISGEAIADILDYEDE